MVSLTLFKKSWIHTTYQERVLDRNFYNPNNPKKRIVIYLKVQENEQRVSIFTIKQYVKPKIDLVS